MGSAYNLVETRYDALGRVSQQSAPCAASSCAAYWNTFQYDALNRVTLQQRPISAANATLQSTSVNYLGRTTSVTDAQARTTVLQQNVPSHSPTGMRRTSQPASREIGDRHRRNTQTGLSAGTAAFTVMDLNEDGLADLGNTVGGAFDRHTDSYRSCYASLPSFPSFAAHRNYVFTRAGI